MKKLLTIVLASFLVLAAKAQSSEPAGLLEVFGGKYRSVLLSAPGVRSINCTSILNVRCDDVVYTLLGSERGDQFQISAVRGTDILMRQCFYMNGELASDASTLGNWFDDGTLKLKTFLRDVFSIDMTKRH